MNLEERIVSLYEFAKSKEGTSKELIKRYLLKLKQIRSIRHISIYREIKLL